jgi:glycosyltransferase involved in cell wall biosynthesis
MSEDIILKVITVGNAPSVKGGITSVISQILSHNWNEQNIEMRFIPTFEGGNAVNKAKSFTKGYLHLRKACKSGNVNVVHIHMSHNGSFMRKYYIHKLCKRYDVADIIHLHSSGFVGFYDNSSKYKKGKIRELLTECGCVVALGDEWEHRVKRIAPNANVCVMNNTVALPAEVVDVSKTPVSFLYLGVLVKRKGVIDLLKTVAKLKDTGVLDEHSAVFNIGGTGECEAELKTFVEEHKLNDCVQFLGWIDGEEKKKQLLNNEILVLPSYNEGLPIAILEALSYGMPIVATNVGSVAEAVHNGENGFLYEAGDIDALFNSLKEMIESPEIRKAYSKNSRKLAEEVFDDKKYFERLNELYRELA